MVADALETLRRLIAGERKRRTAGRLHNHDQLAYVAERHVRWMAEHKQCNHRGQDDQAVRDRTLLAGYRALLLGECLGTGATAFDVFDRWRRDTTAYSIMTRDGFHDTGLGCATGLDGHTYWCVVFGSFRQEDSEDAEETLLSTVMSTDPR